MLKTLIKKQLLEIFRSFFVNTKKNTARSRAGTIAVIAGFAALMVCCVGVMFTSLAVLLCEPLVQVGMDALFFVVMGVMALFLGIFGSVFNTYSSLYKAKDNDLLLSMPIPVNTIMASRLMGVVLMAAMYSVLVSVPAVAVYLIFSGFTVIKLIGGLVYIAVIISIVFVMSCLLGYLVARVSVKIRNKSLVITVISLAAFGAYMYLTQNLYKYVEIIIQNALVYGEKLKGSVRAVYEFGNMGTGDLTAMLIFIACAAVLIALTWLILSRSFIKLATSTGAQKKNVYKGGKLSQSSAFGALLKREFSRLVSSPLYMMNGCLGTVFMPLLGVYLLLKGSDMFAALNDVFAADPSMIAALMVAGICAICAMNDMTAPSIALEGKTLWILRSLPAATGDILLSKLSLQVVITLPCVIFVSVCAAVASGASAVQTVFLLALPIAAEFLLALLGLIMGIVFPNLNWTNEAYAVKQGIGVVTALFGGWVYALALGGLYVWKGSAMGFVPYMSIALAVTIAADAGMYLWLMTKGAKRFERL